MLRDAAAPWAEPVLTSADDLWALSDEAWQYELVRGRLVRMPPTGLEHGALELRLGSVLLQFVDNGGLGLVTGAETGFLLSLPGEPDTVLAPDIAFIAAHRVPAPDTRGWQGFPRLAPDLVVEIASSSQYRPEMAAKVKLWLGAGVPLVWVIWPGTRQVDVWHAAPEIETATLEGSDELDGDTVLPGFRYSIARLWR